MIRRPIRFVDGSFEPSKGNAVCRIRGRKQEAHPSCFSHCAEARKAAGSVSLPSGLGKRNEPCRPAERECQSQESVLSCGKGTNRGNTSCVAAAGTARSSPKKGGGASRTMRGRGPKRRGTSPGAATCQPFSVPPLQARRAQQLPAIPTTQLRRAGGRDHRAVRDAHTTASRRSPPAYCRARSARRRARNTH